MLSVASTLLPMVPSTGKEEKKKDKILYFKQIILMCITKQVEMTSSDDELACQFQQSCDLIIGK